MPRMSISTIPCGHRTLSDQRIPTMNLSPEILGLLLGLAFSLAVFAFKTAVGESCFLVESENTKRNLLFLLAATAAYGVVFFLVFLLLSLFPGMHQALLERSTLLQAGGVLHLLVAAGFLVWGILLLGTKPDRKRNIHGGWLLALPCPVCMMAILLAGAFAELLLPDSKWMVRLFVPGIFFLVNFLVLGCLSFLIRRRKVDSRHLVGRLMVFVGLYFAGLLLLVPNFERIEGMYRIVSGSSELPRINPWYLLPVPIVFLAGLAYQRYQENREF